MKTIVIVTHIIVNKAMDIRIKIMHPDHINTVLNTLC